MTRDRINALGEGMVFADSKEVTRAYASGSVDLQAKIKASIQETIIEEDGSLTD